MPEPVDNWFSTEIMTFLVPETLESERLTLRQFKEADWVDLHEYYSDAVATKYTVGKVFDEGETWRAMCSIIGHWQVRGYGPYAVVEKSSNKVLGPIGFWYPADWPSPEIMWGLAPSHWGKGFASEAARLVLKAGQEHLPDIALISLIHAENSASIQLAKAIGATFEKEMEFRNSVFQVYRHARVA